MSRALASIKAHTDPSQYSVILQSNRQSVALNVNQGAAKVSTPWFVLWNDDWECTSDAWLDTLTKSASEHAASFVSARFMAGGRAQIGYFISINGLAGPLWGDASSQGIVEYAHPVLINTAAFRTLGGYDTAFVGSQFGDIDFILRAKKAGYITALAPVDIKHRYNENPTTNAVKNASKERNARTFRKKHGFPDSKRFMYR